ncbi:CYTH domain-containing protein [Cesiribacter sp. SM1]|uniref:CYTH domain-containing protein n=1 Tax=Cesiribacter sp. SM1 TaxID=2861196 RepID=UPI001CD53FBF|nr:CYTH domain-containing protein [Cesiribacter sp. SM1]
MGVEIERKFLVIKDLWLQVTPDSSSPMRQAYLSTDPDKTIRVRTAGNKGYLTIKGRPKGITRSEFEWEIPQEEAHALIDNFCSDIIEKTRHFVRHQGKLWEVDEFMGNNAGLLVAELELLTEAEAFEKPAWIGEEVTLDKRYLNSQLVNNPYCNWKNED